MKFRIIASLILLVVLGVAYILFQNNQPTTPTPSQDDGIVLH